MLSHASYILLTAIWPLVDITGFMMVTGAKTDIWLVKTVGALLIPVGLCLLSCVSAPSQRPAIILGSGICISFIIVDLYYALNDVISDIYLADALVEFLFLAGWTYILVADVSKQEKQSEPSKRLT